jgi:hypothetical protein
MSGRINRNRKPFLIDNGDGTYSPNPEWLIGEDSETDASKGEATPNEDPGVKAQDESYNDLSTQKNSPIKVIRKNLLNHWYLLLVLIWGVCIWFLLRSESNITIGIIIIDVVLGALLAVVCSLAFAFNVYYFGTLFFFLGLSLINFLRKIRIR